MDLDGHIEQGIELSCSLFQEHVSRSSYGAVFRSASQELQDAQYAKNARAHSPVRLLPVLPEVSGPSMEKRSSPLGESTLLRDRGVEARFLVGRAGPQ
ncbi:hypothetical protein MRX96_018563 [Rhipicephalus microplus]